MHMHIFMHGKNMPEEKTSMLSDGSSKKSTFCHMISLQDRGKFAVFGRVPKTCMLCQDLAGC